MADTRTDKRILPTPRSALADVAWPTVPAAGAATLYAIAQQLEQSQWLSRAELEGRQFAQLGLLLAHAAAQVPYYRELLARTGYRPGSLTPESWQKIPILRRAAIAAQPDAFISVVPPPSHGAITRIATSGTSGKPLTVAKTELEQLMWQALTLRDELWQRWDWSGSLAVIRGKAEGGVRGRRLPDWGPPLADLYPTGPAHVLDIGTDTREQAVWLLGHQPDYLLTTAGNLLRLVDWFGSAKERLTRLKAVRAIGDPVDDPLRAACRTVLGVEIVDLYSCTEIGALALQCPEAGRLHIQMESALIEILDASGAPCPPGAIGEVVATPLHNFAMPLIRYAIGDRAEAGSPCPCGRGLLTIARIVGRTAR